MRWGSEQKLPEPYGCIEWGRIQIVPVSKLEAIATADAFILKQLSQRLVADSARYHRETATWTVTYPRPTRPGETTDPSHLVVVVGSGEASFFPVM